MTRDLPHSQPDALVRGADAIARVLGCSRRNIYELKKRDNFPAWKANGKTSPLVSRRADLVDWLEREIKEAPAGKLDDRGQGTR